MFVRQRRTQLKMHGDVCKAVMMMVMMVVMVVMVVKNGWVNSFYFLLSL